MSEICLPQGRGKKKVGEAAVFLKEWSVGTGKVMILTVQKRKLKIAWTFNRSMKIIPPTKQKVASLITCKGCIDIQQERTNSKILSGKQKERKNMIL